MGDVLNAWVEGERDCQSGRPPDLIRAATDYLIHRFTVARDEFSGILAGEGAWSLVPQDELDADAGGSDDEADGEGAGSRFGSALRPTRAAWSLATLLSQVTGSYKASLASSRRDCLTDNPSSDSRRSLLSPSQPCPSPRFPPARPTASSQLVRFRSRRRSGAAGKDKLDIWPGRPWRSGWARGCVRLDV